MYNYKVTTSSAEWRTDVSELDAEEESEYRRRDANTGEHPGTVYIFYSVRAGGSCCNSLSNVHPGKQNQDIHLPAKRLLKYFGMLFSRKNSSTLCFSLEDK